MESLKKERGDGGTNEKTDTSPLDALYNFNRSPEESPAAKELESARIMKEEQARSERAKRLEEEERVRLEREKELLKVRETLSAEAKLISERERLEEVGKENLIIERAQGYDFEKQDGERVLALINEMQDLYIIEINELKSDLSGSYFAKKRRAKNLKILEQEFLSFEEYKREFVLNATELQKELRGEKDEMHRERLLVTRAYLVNLDEIQKKISSLPLFGPEFGKRFLELGPMTYEKYLLTIHPFLLGVYKKSWSYSWRKMATVKKTVSDSQNIHIDEEIPFDEMESTNDDVDKYRKNESKVGEVFINSESVDYRNKELFVPKIPDKVRKGSIADVMKYVHETYKDTHIIPDVRYYKYLFETSEAAEKEKDPIKKEEILSRIPTQMRESSSSWFFPGSAIVHEDGHWVTPVIDFRFGAAMSLGFGVNIGWSQNYEVILLKR